MPFLSSIQIRLLVAAWKDSIQSDAPRKDEIRLPVFMRLTAAGGRDRGAVESCECSRWWAVDGCSARCCRKQIATGGSLVRRRRDRLQVVLVVWHFLNGQRMSFFSAQLTQRDPSGPARHDGNPALKIRQLEIRDAVKIPLVLHGASGIPEDEIHAAKKAGVHKFNADTDLRHVFRQGMLDVWSKGDRQLEDAMAEGRTRMVAATIEKMKLYGCAGKAPTSK